MIVQGREDASVGSIYAVETIAVAYGYSNRSILFDNVNLAVERGKSIALMGRSGSGKSTLLRIINGSIRPIRGMVRVLGVEVYGKYSNGLRRRVAYIPQSLGLVDNATVLENVLLARAADSPFRALLGLWRKEDVDGAMSILKSIGLYEKARSKVNMLSGGERQRVAIARALMQGARVVLADEPVSNLDQDNARSILDIFKEMGRRNSTSSIIVMHDRALAEEYADEAYMLADRMLSRLW
ncbi:MAG: ATP-binding cassette domain-containing protein [Nitrososphaera sp.]|jgi:ABC-type phosphate/phosphonate transport system ATPase subunit|uniref:phosphonate ABC transporter ATP-binding protein n=1 Tax=Candidatus Nitrosocaldus islandicus TaxID=2045011 RepID=UPI000CCFF23B|nr:ATP-binding cassette domain-containing protein [Candidatus Nitrosocaldus islandicus]